MESLSQSRLDLDIETLIKPNASTRCQSTIYDFIQPPFNDFDTVTEETDFDIPSENTSCFVPGFIESKTYLKRAPDVATTTRGQTVVVKGEDISDLPTQYTVEDLRKHEIPVIGTYVHPSIVQGFKYRVRLLGTDKYHFSAQPLLIQRIGLGYGKRITFESKLKNVNNNYFYSDTRPQGYGFSIVAIQSGQSFTVLDSEDRPLGSGLIDEVGASQMEVASHVDDNCSVVKHVAVWFTCSVRYGARHGVFPLVHDDKLEVSGLATVVKMSGASRAATREITQVDLPLLGTCTLHVEQ